MASMSGHGYQKKSKQPSIVSGFNPLEKYYSSNWVSSSPKFRSEHNSQVF